MILRGDGTFERTERDGVVFREYPNTPPTIVHNLARGAERFADAPLLVTDDAIISYTEFASLVEGAAARLAAEGLRPGDRLAVALRGGLDAAVAIWACARGGFVYVGLPITLKPAQWAYHLEHSGAALALADKEFFDGLADAAATAGLAPDRVREVGDHLTGDRLRWRRDAALPDPDDVYGVVYTSGTTGRPKASQLVHRSTMNVAGFYLRTLGLTPGDRTAIHLPFYYVSGHVSQLNPFLLAGGSAVPMPRFTPGELVRVLVEYRVTVIDVVPSIFELLLREPGFRYPELAHVRAAYFGGAPMLASTVDELRERMLQLRLLEVYGMSETGGTISALSDVEFDRKRGTVGRPVPCADIRLVDDAGADVAPGEAGELLVRGPMVTTGYLGDPEATRAALQDGWLRTGDLARADDEGYLTVVGRTKDMINRGGVKVYPAELERLLAAHPDVAEAAVFPVPDELTGEAVAAAVVPAAGRRIDATALRTYVRAEMAAHAVPRHLSIVDELPRNPTGKVDKVRLRRSPPPS